MCRWDYGFDDALHAAGRPLWILSHADRPLSALTADVPRYPNTQPVLVLRAEARTAARLDQITQTLGAALARFPEVGPVRW